MYDQLAALAAHLRDQLGTYERTLAGRPFRSCGTSWNVTASALQLALQDTVRFLTLGDGRLGLAHPPGLLRNVQATEFVVDAVRSLIDTMGWQAILEDRLTTWCDHDMTATLGGKTYRNDELTDMTPRHFVYRRIAAETFVFPTPDVNVGIWLGEAVDMLGDEGKDGVTMLHKPKRDLKELCGFESFEPVQARIDDGTIRAYEDPDNNRKVFVAEDDWNDIQSGRIDPRMKAATKPKVQIGNERKSV